MSWSRTALEGLTSSATVSVSWRMFRRNADTLCSCVKVSEVDSGGLVYWNGPKDAAASKSVARTTGATVESVLREKTRFHFTNTMKIN